MSQPSDQTVQSGAIAVFTTTATGSPSPTYQWERSADGVTWTAITGATQAGYVFTAQITDHLARFRVKASNSGGTATSLTATLTVSGGGSGPVAPAFTTQPASQSVAAGSTATFMITATGSPSPIYQWERSADGLTWTFISGATLASYTFTAQIADHLAKFRVRATNSAGSAVSNVATLTVSGGSGTIVAPAFTTQPTNQVVSAGTVATFSAQANGNPAPTYQWERSADGATWTDIGGATQPSYAFTAQATDNLAKFRVKANNSAGSATSNAASLTVSGGSGSIVAPAFSVQPTDQFVAAGSPVVFAVTATGNPAPTYQWERSSDGLAWSFVTGATQASYTFTVQASDHLAKFRAKASNSAGTAISNQAMLTVSSAVQVDPKRQIAAGGTHSLWIRSDGTVWSWGSDNNRVAPTQVPGLDGQYVAVAAGDGHSLALKADGSVWAWGGNGYGQLGDGTTVSKSRPIAVSGLSEKIIAIAAGANHSLALAESGIVWGWGYNGLCQLGDGTSVVRYSPVRVQNLSGVQDVSASGNCSLALKPDGTVWEWGERTLLNKFPTQVVSLAGIVSVVAGPTHALALKRDGALLAWGSNGYGELGDDTGVSSGSPVLVKSPPDFRAVAAGNRISLGLKADGSLWAWGTNTSGQLGDGTTQTRYSPWPVTGMTKDIAAIAAGGRHCLVVKTDGTVWAWGENVYCQLGDGTWSGSRHEPVRTAGMEGDAARVVGGASHSLALGRDGRVWTWGANASGQLGDTTRENRRAPVLVEAIKDVRAIAAGGDHCLALRSDGSMIWAWGSNVKGQLGDGSTIDSLKPIQVPVTTGKVVALAAGASHSLALKEDGTVWAWGSNSHGQLGNGTTVDSLQPIQVLGLTGKVVAIAAGVAHSLVLKEDGTVWAWGLNYEGELGNNSTVDSSRPVPVADLAGITKIAAGKFHNLALKNDGTVYGWGDNFYGQIGDGTNQNDRFKPVQVVSLTDIQDVGAGEDHSLVLKRDGTLWGWGANSSGQLGLGSLLLTSVPTQLMDISNVKLLSVSDNTSYAERFDGTLWSWGLGTYGNLGDASKITIFSRIPVRINNRISVVGL